MTLGGLKETALAEDIRSHFAAFERLLVQASDLMNRGRLEEAAFRSRTAAEYAWSNHPGIFASSRLEHVLLAIGRAFAPTAPSSGIRRPAPQTERVVHVLTQAYPIGGHTRLVWRLIQRDRDRIHSVVLTDQRELEIPHRLAEAVRTSHGSLHVLDAENGSLLSRAHALRKLVLPADRIVLHIHPHDVVPVVALADRNECPPVVFLNHADHVFWLGVGVSDVVASIRESGLRLAKARRGIEDQRCMLLPIPLEPVERTLSRQEAKKLLGIPDDSVMILSVASPYKYAHPTGVGFVDAVRPVLEQHARAVLVLVGPGPEGAWREGSAGLQARIMPVGHREDVASFYEAADIYVDSYPFASLTSLLEAGSAGVPLVSCCTHPETASTLCADSPGLSNTLIRVSCVDELRKTLARLIEDAEFRSRAGAHTREEILDVHGGERWTGSLQQVYLRAGTCAQTVIAPRPCEQPSTGDLDLRVAELQRRRDAVSVEGLRAQVHAFQAHAHALRARAESAEARVQELTRDVELLIHERDAILNSKSWRLTAPLRWLLSMIARIARFLRACVRIGASPAQLAWLLRQGAAVYRRGGVREAADKILAYAARQAPDGTYDEWIKRYDTLTDRDREAIRRRAGAFSHTPLVSVIMPTYNTPAGCLREAIDSVRRQLYPHWELCIADDASTVPHVRAIVDEARAADPRIKAVFRERNGHIAEASNSALAVAEGEYVALLDHDDVLADHALYMVAEELNRHPDADLVYSDEDKIDAHGRRYEPYFKPEWSPDLFCSQNLITHLGVYRTSLVRAIGGFRKGYEGSQDYDLALRVVERTSGARIRHIPWILYHWRAVIGSVATASGAKPYAHEAAQRAIREYFERQGEPVEMVGVRGVFHRVRRPLPQSPPLVSVIIPTRDRVDLLRTCVEGILNETDYRNLEIIIVDNASRDERTLAYLSETARNPRVRVLKHDGPFNFSAMNNRGARIAAGEILGFLNNDLRVISPEWLSEMVSHAVRPEVGAVGAMLYYPAGAIQHAGVVTGIGGVAGHVHKGQPRGLPGYFGRAGLIQNFSAVTAACMVLRRGVFEEAGRLDEANLAVAFNDVDLCLRIRERGYLIVWTPYAQLFHAESASRGPDDVPARRARFHRETEYMRRRWGSALANDPYYNPNLTLEREDFSLAFPPRVRRPWLEARVAVHAVRS